MKRTHRAQIAQDTLAICEARHYLNSSGREVELGTLLDRAVGGSRAISPDEVLPPPHAMGAKPCDISVTPQSTLQAIAELHEQGAPGLACLNFASAKNPGGGFLGGAHAQEESLARSSGLYPCLMSQPEYYEANRGCGTSLYTDWIIWSPDVPFFRDDEGILLDAPAVASVITAPAPNAGAVSRNEPQSMHRVTEVLRGRGSRVLALAAAQGVRTLILAAWGCGVFRNDPSNVAQVFASLLVTPGPYAHAFDRVVFAIYDTTAEASVLRAFNNTFSHTAVP